MQIKSQKIFYFSKGNESVKAFAISIRCFVLFDTYLNCNSMPA